MSKEGMASDGTVNKGQKEIYINYTKALSQLR